MWLGFLSSSEPTKQKCDARTHTHTESGAAPPPIQRQARSQWDHFRSLWCYMAGGSNPQPAVLRADTLPLDRWSAH